MDEVKRLKEANESLRKALDDVNDVCALVQEENAGLYGVNSALVTLVREQIDEISALETHLGICAIGCTIICILQIASLALEYLF